MIIILGSSGYVGSKYMEFLSSRGVKFLGFSRRQVDYTTREGLSSLIRSVRPLFLINAAGYTGKPNVDACELDKAGTLVGNAVLPAVVAAVCGDMGLPWGHVSSGCIYSGRRPDGGGWREDDTPNFCFRSGRCSFYSGTKALGEEIIAGSPDCYVWRLRIPFNHEAGPRNYLTKLMSYDRLLEAENSVSHLDEFVRATWECWERRVPFGLYNVTNPGSVTTGQVVGWIREAAAARDAAGLPVPFRRDFSFYGDEEEFMQKAAKTPRSNCVVDSSKLASVGITMSPVEEAFKSSLRNWKVEN
jgi:dTDP-4-dehydrorhamnose reductase